MTTTLPLASWFRNLIQVTQISVHRQTVCIQRNFLETPGRVLSWEGNFKLEGQGLGNYIESGGWVFDLCYLEVWSISKHTQGSEANRRGVGTEVGLGVWLWVRWLVNSRCAGFNNMVFVKIISDLVANSTWLGNLRIAPLHSVIYAILPYSYPLLLICLNGFWPERSEITYGPEMSEITESCGPETTTWHCKPINLTYLMFWTLLTQIPQWFQ